jgi:hypothetical protein
MQHARDRVRKLTARPQIAFRKIVPFSCVLLTTVKVDHGRRSQWQECTPAVPFSRGGREPG